MLADALPLIVGALGVLLAVGAFVALRSTAAVRAWEASQELRSEIEVIRSQWRAARADLEAALKAETVQLRALAEAAEEAWQRAESQRRQAAAKLAHLERERAAAAVDGEEPDGGALRFAVPDFDS